MGVPSESFGVNIYSLIVAVIRSIVFLLVYHAFLAIDRIQEMNHEPDYAARPILDEWPTIP
jgi:hypothetical protein